MTARAFLCEWVRSLANLVEVKTPSGGLLAYLRPLGVDGSVISTEVLLPYCRRLLFAIPAPCYWRREGRIWRVPFLGLGGCRHPGEDIPAGLQRAVREEAGVAIRLVDSPFSLYFDGDRKGRPLPLGSSLQPRPCYVWKSHSRLVASFQAELVDPARPPVPGKGVKALLGLHASQILAMGEEGADLQPLLADGAVLEGADLPQPAVTYPWGTPRYLPRYLEALAYRREWP